LTSSNGRSSSQGALPNSAADEISRLRDENNELKLYVAAVLRLLVSKGIASNEEIQSLVRAIDVVDGIPHGRYEGGVGISEEGIQKTSRGQ
jgi:hypothetical protein